MHPLCLICPLAVCRGTCACSVDGLTIEGRTSCPKHRFGRLPLQAIPDDYEPETSADSPKRGSCCDSPKKG